MVGENGGRLRDNSDAGKALLTFEDDQSPDDLTRYLNHNFCLHAGSTILCRIANDGRGHQTRGNVVRPGRKYLLLSSAGPVRTNAFTSPTTISCEGLNAALLCIPKEISAE